MSKNLSLGINIVLAIAVIILYFLHFSKSEGSQPTAVKNEVATATNDSMPIGPVPIIENVGANSGKVVYVNYDSLMENYDFYKKISKDLEGKLKNTETELMAKQKKLEEDYQQYQQNQAMMTEQHRATKEQQLMLDNQKLVELRDRKSQQLASQEKELNDKLLSNLYGYFRKLAVQNNFSYILTYKKGVPGVLYGSDSLDITKTVVQGLNKEYNEGKKK
ncbi:MAG TPA: OmpH family outer membrane protein [Cytophagaceae bacterium]|jgi:outer membrane protein